MTTWRPGEKFFVATSPLGQQEMPREQMARIQMSMTPDGLAHVVVTSAVGGRHALPVIRVCRICGEHGIEEAEAFDLDEGLPDYVSRSGRCFRGHIVTLPDEYLFRRSPSTPPLVVIPAPSDRSILVGKLGMPQALRLLTLSQGVVDGTVDLAELAQELEASPEPVRQLRPKLFTKDQWIAVAMLIATLMGPLIPLILAAGSVDEPTIVIHLEQLQPEQQTPQDGVEPSDQTPPGESQIEAPNDDAAPLDT